MTSEQIENFLTPEAFSKIVVISFKTRNTMRGIFLNTGDFDHLKTKNFWRILPESRLEDWKKTKDNGLARIYNGSEFTKLTVKQTASANN